MLQNIFVYKIIDLQAVPDDKIGLRPDKQWLYVKKKNDGKQSRSEGVLLKGSINWALNPHLFAWESHSQIPLPSFPIPYSLVLKF